MRKINEIFYSLQGEGFHTGTPAVFIRFSGCNLKCSFCDTQHEEGVLMSDEEILDAVGEYPATTVILTGGEPSLWIDREFVDRLHRIGKGLFHLPVTVQRLDAEMRGDPVAAVDNGGRRGQQLDCCDLERLPESHGSQLHISHILFFMHDSPSFSRQVDAGALF